MKTIASIQRNNILEQRYYDYPEELEGGRNLFSGSSFTGGDLSEWSSNGDVVFVKKDDKNSAMIKGVSRGIYQTPMHLKDNTIYSISFKARSIEGRSSVTGGFLNQATGRSMYFSLNEEWKTYTHTIESALTGGNRLYHFYANDNTDSGFYIADVKMESGGNTTPYTLAPEDMGLEYDEDITSFTESTKELKRVLEFPKEIEGSRNWFDKGFLFDETNWIKGVYSSSKRLLQLKPNTGYVFQADIKAHNEGEWGVLNVMDGTNGVKKRGEEGYIAITSLYNFKERGEENNYTRRFTTPNSGRVFFAFYNDSPTNHWILDKLIKPSIKEGSSPSKWTPSPEDILLDCPDYLHEFTPFKNSDSNSTLAILGNYIEYPPELEGGRNCIVAKDTTLGNYLFQDSGDLGSSSGHMVSGFISALPNTNYILSSSENLHQIRFVYYDSTQTYISGELHSRDQGTTVRTQAPSRTRYMRCSLDHRNGDSLEVSKLEVGSNPTPYTLAPEDMGLEYPLDVVNFRTSFNERYVIAPSFIRYPRELSGGINLISKDDIGIRSAGDLNLTQFEDEGTMIYETDTRNGGIVIYGNLLEPNTDYTISYSYQKLEGELVSFGGHSSAPWINNQTYLDGSDKGVRHNASTSGYAGDDEKVHRVEVYLTTPDEINGNSLFYIQPNRGQPVYVKTKIWGWKLEKGTRVTPWTPSPKDISYAYPEWVKEFKPSINREGILMQEYIRKTNLFPITDNSKLADYMTENPYSTGFEYSEKTDSIHKAWRRASQLIEVQPDTEYTLGFRFRGQTWSFAWQFFNENEEMVESFNPFNTREFYDEFTNLFYTTVTPKDAKYVRFHLDNGNTEKGELNHFKDFVIIESFK